jgi:hypothetical protein
MAFPYFGFIDSDVRTNNCGVCSQRLEALRTKGPGIESRLRARFSVPSQTGPGANPVSSTPGTGSFPWVKLPGRGVDHPPPSSAEVKERVQL